MIEVKNLTKRYGAKLAVDNISFSVAPGEILGFLGPNGAGKSTTMNILTGYLSATSGVAKIGAFDILEQPMEAKKHIGFLPEQPPLYPDMTVKDYLNFIFDLKKVKLPRKKHIEEVCRIVKIADVYPRIIKNLSKGYRQRVGLAQALIGNPDVLILDEPTVGLDPKQIIEIRNVIRGLSKKHTIILSSHILPEVQAVCDRVVVINKGKIVADDTTDHLSERLTTDFRYTVRVDGPKNEVLRLIETIPGMRGVSVGPEHEKGCYDYEFESQPQTDVRRELFKRLSDRNWPILELKSNALTLEDIFLKLTNDQDFNPPVGEKTASDAFLSPSPAQPANGAEPGEHPEAKSDGGEL